MLMLRARWRNSREFPAGTLKVVDCQGGGKSVGGLRTFALDCKRLSEQYLKAGIALRAVLRMESECPTMDRFTSSSSADSFASHSQDRCGERSLPFLRKPPRGFPLFIRIDAHRATLQHWTSMLIERRYKSAHLRNLEKSSALGRSQQLETVNAPVFVRRFVGLGDPDEARVGHGKTNLVAGGIAMAFGDRCAPRLAVG